MANFTKSYDVQSADVVTQITGLGSQMGIDIIIKAKAGEAITVTTGSTIQLNWTDGNGAQTLAKVLIAGVINDTTGLTLGTYYPDGQVFADQTAVNNFFTGAITAKIYKATVA